MAEDDGRSSLRHRITKQADGGNVVEGGQNETAKEKKTMGKTSTGIAFIVPKTDDMVSQLLHPSKPKTPSDFLILSLLCLHGLLALFLPVDWRIPIMGALFLFWRACYNLGIGVLLHLQSKDHRLVTWANKSGLFQRSSGDSRFIRWLQLRLKKDFEKKIPEDYSFEEAPIEYNTWLVFRRVVDLILMCDFVSYILFACVCAHRPDGEQTGATVGRWAAGITLFLINLWVKLDAHRVVKDFAWYWGDFFYLLLNQDLTFDGVFEMAPHPMYSVGYTGYYGISLMAGSYHVMFISIIAHAAQLAFLQIVENPHIEKTYNPPPSRQAQSPDMAPMEAGRIEDEDDAASAKDTAGPSFDQPTEVTFLQRFDLSRIAHTTTILFAGYSAVLTVLTPDTPAYQTAFFVHALVWRFWYGAGIGIILIAQSQRLAWTRHFVKIGLGRAEAWAEWKGLFQISMTMTYMSLFASAWKMYNPPEDWTSGFALLKHTIGLALIMLHIWSAGSIYESLGEFGWFFGDFFFPDRQVRLVTTGIYRFVSNPEQVFGCAAPWGLAIIAGRSESLILALVAHVCTVGFIHLVERPHMWKLYGVDVSRDAGIMKNIKRSIPRPLKKLHGNVDKAMNELGDSFEEFFETAKPRLAAGVGEIVKDVSTSFKYPVRLTLTRLRAGSGQQNPQDYSLQVTGTASSTSSTGERMSGREGEKAREPVASRDGSQPLILEYGTPLKVEWCAPKNHSRKDWVGLYMVADNQSREMTQVPSRWRWTATNRGSYDEASAILGLVQSNVPVPGEDRHVTGEMTFFGDKLWWTQGVFEFRYHHDGHHSVMAISRPFEIRISRFDDGIDDEVDGESETELQAAAEKALLPLVRNCLDRDPAFAPSSVGEQFGSLLANRDEKFARRIVFGVHEMFGVEFAPAVVVRDCSVASLAWNICRAKKVLAPYSMQTGRGTGRPNTPKH